MTAFEVARLIAQIVEKFGLAWPHVRELVILAYPHMQPHVDAAIQDMDRARADAFARTGGAS